MIDILCKDIVRQFKINRFVETGTDKGETVAQASRWFSEFDPDFGKVTDTLKTGARSYVTGSEPIAYPVFTDAKASRYQIHSVDTDHFSYQTAKEHFHSNPNIVLSHSSSQEFLASLLAPEINGKRTDHRYLFFLDAHWGKYWPLRDELKVIRQLDKYLVVIDDFMVPGKSDPAFPHGPFGFDVYKGKLLNWAYISDLFGETRVQIFYPRRPNRDQRGWVLLAHGYSEEELKFLKSLNLFEVDQFAASHTAPVSATWRSYLDGRNILKGLVPVSFLRSIHRVYEKILFYSGTLFTQHK